MLGVQKSVIESKRVEMPSRCLMHIRNIKKNQLALAYTPTIQCVYVAGELAMHDFQREIS